MTSRRRKQKGQPKLLSSLELARLCGVSQGTVDRALHNRGRIAKDTRERILEVARRFGYIPNPTARELLTRQSRFVGAVVPTVTSVFFMHLIEELRLALREYGVRLIVSPASDAGEAREILTDFVARRFRGIVIIPPEERIGLGNLPCIGSPIVSLVNPCDMTEVLFIGPNEEQTGADGVAYLVSCGHRRILFVSYPRRSWAMEARERGYTAAMARHGLDPRMIIGLSVEKLMEEVERNHPTAVFCHNDWLALSTIRILERHGLSIPRDISVLGIDNSPVFNLLCPGLTTMEYPAHEVAVNAAEVLVTGGKVRPISRFRIVERETVRTLVP